MTDTESFSNLVVAEDSTIRDAMAAITENKREVVLVRDQTGKIVGLITDGDIRRGLLSGLVLESTVAKVMTREFYFVGAAVDRVFALDVMKSRAIGHIPVLDTERRLVAIHFLRDLIGTAVKPNIAVIMAGGKGTRLRPLTENLPKPMVEVAGRPILERIVLHLVGYGVRRIFLSVNYMADVIEKHFGDGSAFGCQIEYLHETRPLGTGGALKHLPVRPSDPILVLNGDQVTRVDVTSLLNVHRSNGCDATVGVGPYQVQIPFGTMNEKDGRLISIEEKPTINFIVNRGIYVLNPSALDHVVPDCEFPITRLFELLLEAGKPVGTFYFDDYWVDVGQAADLRRANGII